MLNALGEHVRDGLRLDHGEPVPGCVVGDVGVAEVADPRRLTFAQALLGNDDLLVPALQLVRPDARGRWPWEPGWRGEGEEFFGRRPDGCVPLRRSGGSPRSGRGQRSQPRRRSSRD